MNRLMKCVPILIIPFLAVGIIYAQDGIYDPFAPFPLSYLIEQVEYDSSHIKILISENDETLSNITDGDVVVTFDDDAATLGEFFIASEIDTPNIADNDLFNVKFQANGESSTLINWVTIEAKILDATENSKDSHIAFKSYASNTEGTALTLTGTTATFGGNVAYSNGGTFENLVNHTFEWNENSDELIWTFGGNTVMVSSGDVTLFDYDIPIRATKVSTPEVRLGQSVLDSLGRVLLYVQNKTGSSLTSGDAVCWDNASVIVVADAPMAHLGVIANNLTAEGGFRTLSLTMTGTADAGDSVTVYGRSYEAGTFDVTKMLIPAVENVVFMVTDSSSGNPLLHWSDIDSVVFNSDATSNGATSCIVNSYGVSTVIASDGANTDVAGVAVETIADNAFGYVCVYGAVKATVDAGTLNASPGILLEGAANGDLVTDAAATTGQNIGRCLEYSTADNKQITVFIDSF